MIALHEAVVEKRGTRLLGPVTHDLAGAGTTALLGPSGAGKTTWLRLAHGLERARRGTVTRAPGTASAFVFQSPTILRRSVLDNVAYPLTLRGHAKRDARDRAREWLARADLAPTADRPAWTLSGGERQRMALLRALVTAPGLLFLDEPTSNLDGASARIVERLVAEAVAAGTRAVIATHDIGQVRRLAQDVVFLHRGLVLEHGETRAFLAGPSTAPARAFLEGEIVE